jgi:hypothetical protein
MAKYTIYLSKKAQTVLDKLSDHLATGDRKDIYQ